MKTIEFIHVSNFDDPKTNQLFCKRKRGNHRTLFFKPTSSKQDTFYEWEKKNIYSDFSLEMFFNATL